MNNFLLICSKLAEAQTGGVQTRIINYAKNFKRFEINGTILSIQNYQDILQEDYFGTPLIKYPKKRSWDFIKFYLKLLNKNRFDAIHILEGSLGKLQIISLLIARIKKMKIGISLYGGEMWDIKDHGGLILKLKLKTILFLADFIGVNSIATKSFLPKIYQKKAFIVYPGVNEEYLKYLDIEKIQSNNFDLLYVGRVFRRKGADDIIRAISLLKDKIPHIHLNVIGANTIGKVYSDLARKNKLDPKINNSIDYYRALAKKLGVANKIDFIGEIKELKTIALYYRNCDIFIMTPKITTPPSGYESFGCVYLEANLFKKPVIGTKHYGVKESIIDGNNGLLVNENDYRDLANAIFKLFKNPGLRNSLGNYGYKRVLNNYMDKNSTEQLLKPYFNV